MRLLSLLPLLTLPLFFISFPANAQQPASPDAELEELLSLDITQLTVTSVAKRAQKLHDAPAAIYVITHEDLRRSGITTLPEALRMVPGMEVAQAGSHSWAVSARGFNAVLDNKMLVLVDGRSIYTPVFSGVYWEDKAPFMEDVERIEVIRGPGASLWGANAVNGVINIITKRAADTQGKYLATRMGTEENALEGRHGEKIGKDTYYRTYAHYTNYDETDSNTNTNNPDDWWRARAGFRVDSQHSSADSYTIQGDIYNGRQQAQTSWPFPAVPFSRTFITNDGNYGGNISGHWNHEISADSSLSVQTYIDHYSRDEFNANQHVTTADADFQHNLLLNDRNNFLWGGGIRLIIDEIKGIFATDVNEHRKNRHMMNLFLQDEYALVPDTLYLTVGSKFEYNDYTQLEVQPNARIAWHPDERQMVWGSVSRAVRTPSDIEQDIISVLGTFAGTPPIGIAIVGNRDQESENLIAYEIGHRITPVESLSFDTSVFFNDYSDLSTVGTGMTPFTREGTLTFPIPFGNLGKGYTYGIEEAITWNVTSNWRLTGSYTHLYVNLDVKPGTIAPLDEAEDLAPRNQLSLRSYWDITDTLRWDNMLYYVGAITPPASAYVRYDTRIGWHMVPGVEVSLIGRNLLEPSHPEFPSSFQAEIERSFLGQVSLKF